MVKSILLLGLILSAMNAFADTPLPESYKPNNELELAQAAILTQELSTQLETRVEIEFSSYELLSLRNGYNHLNDLTTVAMNLVNGDKVNGAALRQLVVKIGPVGYYCEGGVRFIGGLKPENVNDVILHACDGPLWTKSAVEQDNKCYASRAAIASPDCRHIVPVYLPSALVIMKHVIH